MQDERDRHMLEISDLIFRHIQGIASEMEEERLRKWIGESKENKTTFEQLTDQEYHTKRLEDFRLYNVSGDHLPNIWQKINKQPKVRQFTLRQVGAAAAVLLLVTASTIFFRYYMGPSRPIKGQALNDFAPASERAILMMGSGKQVALGDKDTTLQQNGLTVAQQSGTLVYQDENKPVAEQLLVTPRAATFKVTLADGTTVWLNAGSSLRFPSRFDGAERLVELQGEAFFDIAKDTKHPFIVTTTGMRVQALGTSFDVKAYKEERQAKATLITGAVQVNAGERKEVLKPGEQVIYEHEKQRFNTVTADTRQVLGWKDKQFIFGGTSTGEVMQEIGRWYDVDIVYENGFTGEDLYHGEISRTVTLSKLLEMMQTTGAAQFRMQGKTLYVSPHS
jgi:transmembrane sensor